MAVQIVGFLVGAALLLLGRQLYWLFVAGIGFVVAVDLVPRLFQTESTILILVIALAAGVTGALLAVFLQKVAIGIAGFLAGGYLAVTLLEAVGLQSPVLVWVLGLVGAVVGVVLTLALFEWALIILSSMTGAWVVVQSLNLRDMVSGLVFLVLLIVGLAAQSLLFRGADTGAD